VYSLLAAGFFVYWGIFHSPNPFGCSFLLIDKHTSRHAKPFYQSIKIELYFLRLEIDVLKDDVKNSKEKSERIFCISF